MLNSSHLLAAVAIGFSIAAAQEKIDRDTVYHVAPVTISATQATTRLSPVTFSESFQTTNSAAIFRAGCALYCYPGFRPLRFIRRTEMPAAGTVTSTYADLNSSASR